MKTFTLALDRVLQIVTVSLLLALTGTVLLGVVFRYSGNSLIWYDELAAMLLAWITFSGAALAMLRNAHMGFSGLQHALPQPYRDALFWFVEALVLVILGITAWAGWAILAIFGTESLTSLPFLQRSLVQSVLPIGAALMILARLLTMPERLADHRAGLDAEALEIKTEIQRAESEHARTCETFLHTGSRPAQASAAQTKSDTTSSVEDSSNKFTERSALNKSVNVGAEHRKNGSTLTTNQIANTKAKRTEVER